MAEIHLITKISAPIETVFDLARDIDAHQMSMDKTAEKAIAGVTSGKINLGETVTWKGKHFGLWLRHESRITEMQSPSYFVDEMENGHFKTFRHEHTFKIEGEQTLMIDRIDYKVPAGVLGKWIDRFILKNYLTRLIETRNAGLKKMAETVNITEGAMKAK